MVERFKEYDADAPVAPSTCASVQIDGPGYHEKERSGKLLGMLDLSECDCSSEQLDTLRR